jgi:polyribonucleotide nucleotidyltransferase
MFKYLFNGVLFQADSIEELQKALVKAGYVGDVAAEFEAVNQHNQAMAEGQTTFSEDLENMYDSIQGPDNSEINEIIEETTSNVEENDDGSFYIVTEDRLN